MRRISSFLSVVVLIFASTAAFAQDDESIFRDGAWESRTIDEGITLRQCQFEGSLFGSNQMVSILEIAPGYQFDVIEAPAETLLKTTQFAYEAGAIAAVNGSFFRMRHPYGAVTYTRVDGETVGENSNDSGREFWSRGSRQNGSVAIFNGDFFIVKADAIRSWEKYIEAEDVLTAGPLLRIGGKDVPQEENSFNKTRHPRTVVGKRDDGTAVFVVVDGRAPQAAGMSTVELRQMMGWLGCKDALNLDGGGSSAMVVRGEVVNYPCDNKKFDHAGERKVTNVITVRAR